MPLYNTYRANKTRPVNLQDLRKQNIESVKAISTDGIQNDLDRQLVEKITAYLNLKLQKNSRSYDEEIDLTDRIQHCSQLVSSIKAKDVSQEQTLLRENAIKPFKGFFQQKLYNILKEYRDQKPGEEMLDLSLSPKT